MKNIVITGVSGFLGTAVTKTLVNAGYHVIGVDNYESKKPPELAEYFECDLSNQEETQNLYDKIKVKYKTLRAAILLVGGFGMGNIENSTSEDIKKMFELNFITAFNAAQSTYNWMKQSYGGHIILVSAKPVFEGGGAPVLPYVISKTAVAKLSETINESGKEHGIRSSLIVPSVIDTDANRKSMPKANFDDWVKPEKIAESIKFLISEEGSPLRQSVFKLYNNS